MARHRSSAAAPSAALSLAMAQAQERLVAPPAPVPPVTAGPVASAEPALTRVPTARGGHRTTALGRGRIAAAAVATGAFALTVQTVGSDSPAGAATEEVTLTAGTTATPPVAQAEPQVLTVARPGNAALMAALAKGQRLGDERAAREAAARAPLYVRPAQGAFTSGYGARWGEQHLGIDIANAIGTPIVSVAAGTVIEAGPANGFGLWVRVLHDDGTITVYGHVNEIIAQAGTLVAAGQEIATIGNRGNSTGPHLHFEVWQHGKDKIDPQPWLAQRGVDLGSLQG